MTITSFIMDASISGDIKQIELVNAAAISSCITSSTMTSIIEMGFKNRLNKDRF